MKDTLSGLEVNMSRKSVRFQDLSFIQESEEDQPEDATAGVQDIRLHVPSPSQLGGDNPSTTISSNKHPAAATGKENKSNKNPPRPAACPFGDRIAQNRAEKSNKCQGRGNSDSSNHKNNCKNSNPQQRCQQNQGDLEKDTPLLPFPQNVIHLQEEEKRKSAKQRIKSAGVNPSAGKDKGSSFIITRNYLCGITNNSPVLQPRNVYGGGQNQTSQEPSDEGIVDHQQQEQQQQHQSLLPSDCTAQQFVPIDDEYTVSQSDVVLTNIEGETAAFSIPYSQQNNTLFQRQSDVREFKQNYTSSNLASYGAKCNDVAVQNPNNVSVSNSCINHHQDQYTPDSSLSKFVNPFTAPNDQFYGSAAYGLKHTPQDTLTKPDVLKSSCVNQYLHSSKDCTSYSQGTPAYCYTTVTNPQPLTTSTTSPVTETHNTPTRKGEDNITIPADENTTNNDNNNNNTKLTPNCKFLRDNFSGLDCSHCASSDFTPSRHNTRKETTTNKLEQLQQQQQHHHHHQQRQQLVQACTSTSASSGVIGPIVVSPRKQILPSSLSPGLIIDNQTHSSHLPTASASATTPVPSVSNITAAATTATSDNIAATTTSMNFIGNTADMYSHPAPLSRFQEKEELQKLNDRFTSYVTRVRQLGQSANNVDTSAFLRSTKVLEDEIVCLKTLYESELASLRHEIEAASHERNNLHVQCTKHQAYAGEVQDRLAIESDKNSKLLDEINVLRRKIGNLEAEVQDARIASQRPKEEMDHLHRTVENLTRESDQWKHRYDHEQVSRQEAEDRFQQLMKKLEFTDQVNVQQINDYQARLDTSSATILSLEGKVRELSTADVSVAEMLKQVRDTAETELKKYQIESEEQYSRNLSALKAQIDNDADSLSRNQTEKSQLMGNIGELHARIRNLEGQVQNMEHQKLSLEDAVAVERNRAADNIQQLERKLREMQDMLVVKMREITNAREANIPLKAEIETLKALMEEEERRLRVPLGIVSASVVQTSLPATPSTKDILASSISNQVLKPRSPPNSLAAMSAQPTSVGFVTSSSINQQQHQQQQYPQQTFSPAMAAGTVNLTQSAEVCKSVSIAGSLPPRPLPCVQTSMTTTTAAHQQQMSNVESMAQATSLSSSQQQQPGMTNSNIISATYAYPPCAPAGSGIANPLYPYVPSPPLDTMYIPDALDTDMPLNYDPEYGAGDSGCGGVVGYYDSYTPAFNMPMSGPRYQYEAHPSINRLHVEPSPPISPKHGGNSANASRAKSAPATKPTHNSLATQISAAREKDLNLIPSDMGNGRDYFEEMFNDLERNTLFSKARPKSSPLERPVPSTYHDYTVSTSSAIGDLKILEVHQDGKFVRLVNDGPTEFEFGGYMVQQNVGGHPVAVFRFPPRTKFPPDSTITVWSAMNDPHLHNPPTDFFWKEQQKWGTGPECTTILCRANGQAVAWTTAAHRFTKDAFIEEKTDGDDSNKFEYNKEKADDDDDDEALKELTIDANGPRPEPVYLRREKQQPPTLTASKHPHGASPTNGGHPHTGQARPLYYGNDNSSVNRQSRTQTIRPDPIPGQPYAGAPAQRVGSAPLRKMANQGTVRTNVANRSTLDAGETSDSPSPFMRPHSRFDSGLEQVQSQHHPNFLPPMPRPPQASC